MGGGHLALMQHGCGRMGAPAGASAPPKDMVGVEGIFPHLKARAASPPGRARRSMQNGRHARKRLPGRG